MGRAGEEQGADRGGTEKPFHSPSALRSFSWASVLASVKSALGSLEPPVELVKSRWRGCRRGGAGRAAQVCPLGAKCSRAVPAQLGWTPPD